MKTEEIDLNRFYQWGIDYFHGKVVLKQEIKTSGTCYTLLYGTVQYRYGTAQYRKTPKPHYCEWLVFTLIKTISQNYHTMAHLDHLDEGLASSGIGAQDTQNLLRKSKVQPSR